MIQLSSEVPREEPSFFPTPITSQGMLFQRTSLPTGSRPGMRFSTMSMPITQTGAALFKSESVMWRPATRSTSYNSGICGVQARRLVSFSEFTPLLTSTRPPSEAPISLQDLQRSRTASKRSEEHTSELQSLTNLVCRLLLEKKKIKELSHSAATPKLCERQNPEIARTKMAPPAAPTSGNIK